MSNKLWALSESQRQKRTVSKTINSQSSQSLAPAGHRRSRRLVKQKVKTLPARVNKTFGGDTSLQVDFHLGPWDVRTGFPLVCGPPSRIFGAEKPFTSQKKGLEGGAMGLLV